MTNIIEFNVADTLIEYNVTEAGIAELQTKYTGLKASDKDNYKLVTQAISEVRSIRTGVEKKRVEYKANALEYGRKVDAEAKRVTALLLAIEEPLKSEKEIYDAEQEKIKAEKQRIENERIQGILERIERIKNAPFKHHGKSSQDLQKIYTTFQETTAKSDFFDYQEFAEQATSAISITSNRLNDMLKAQLEIEKVAEERKKLEEEKAQLAAEKAKINEYNNDLFSAQPLQLAIPESEGAVIVNKNLDGSGGHPITITDDIFSKKQEDLSNTEKAIVSFTGAIQLMKEVYFPLGKPTYSELVWVVQNLAGRFTCNGASDYEFLDKVNNMLKIIEEEKQNGAR